MNKLFTLHYLLLIVLTAGSLNGWGQSKSYRTINSGDWNNPNTWESSTDNTTWYAAATAPAASDNAINIQNPHKIIVTTPLSLDETSIAGMLDVQAGGRLNIKDGIGNDIDILNVGTIRITS